MAVSFTNNWKNILDKLRSVLRTEFKGALPVFIGDEGQEGTQYIRLDPIGSNWIDEMAMAESREFTIEVYYLFAEHNLKKTALDHVLRYVSRIEALIHDNSKMTLADNSSCYGCRLESTQLNPDEESGTYVVQWEYKCKHTGNIS